MSAGRWTAVAGVLALAAGLYAAGAWLDAEAPVEPGRDAARDRRLAPDEPPAPDAGDRPALRPLDALFLYAEVSRQRERPPRLSGNRERPILRLLASPRTNPLDPERRNGARLRELGLSLEGRTVTFDAAAGVPSRHDELLRALAALAGPELAGVEFEERSPGGAAGDYELWAYPPAATDAGDAVLSATALNFGPWYDLDAVLGLLNVLLKDQGSELRFVCLVTTDRFATVLLGPATAIQSAAAEGLIEVGEASYAMNAGRISEQRDAGPAQ